MPARARAALRCVRRCSGGEPSQICKKRRNSVIRSGVIPEHWPRRATSIRCLPPARHLLTRKVTPSREASPDPVEKNTAPPGLMLSSPVPCPRNTAKVRLLGGR
jgi:hypothetical protein